MREDIKLSLIYLLILLGFELKSFEGSQYTRCTKKKRYIPQNRVLSVCVKQLFVHFLICQVYLLCQSSNRISQQIEEFII